VAYDLNELQVFTRVVQLGSFSAAARALVLPVSTVSRKVAQFETRLGLSLLKRTTRKLSLTEHGQRLFDSCAPHLQGLEDAQAGLAQARTHLEGLLHVSAPLALGRGEFIDFISGFLTRNRKIKLNLIITNQFVDLITSQVDIAIRFGELDDSSVVARQLGLSHRVLVAAPGYLKQRGTPKNPQELQAHDCVLFLRKSEELEWLLQNARQRARIRVSGPISGNNFETVNEFALRGHGIALLPEAYAIAGTAAGALKRVLPQWRSPPIPVHAVYVNRKFVPAKLKTFLGELAAWKNSNWRAAHSQP
jgi:DNA-binding transcriptional LysR family regulator